MDHSRSQEHRLYARLHEQGPRVLPQCEPWWILCSYEEWRNSPYLADESHGQILVEDPTSFWWIQISLHLPGHEVWCTKPRGLEGAEIFGSTKRKLDLPPGSDHDSHRQDKVNFSIPRMSTRSTKARIEEALSDPVHGV